MCLALVQDVHDRVDPVAGFVDGRFRILASASKGEIPSGGDALKWRIRLLVDRERGILHTSTSPVG